MKSNYRKATIVYVLKMLSDGSDEQHPVSQIAMSKALALLEIKCDRKTISRDIKCLIECGYNIVKVAGKGFYLKKNDFTKEDVDLLIKGLYFLDIPNEQKTALKDKVEKLLNVNQRR